MTNINNEIKTNRLFYLDFLRTFSVMTILTRHFNLLYFYRENPIYDKFVFTLYPFNNLSISGLGVGLFFIISGFGLFYISNNKPFSSILYYRKRIKSLIPFFIFCYVFFLPIVYIYYPQGLAHFKYAHLEKLILTLIGMDGYFYMFGISTFYYIGEWFLGCIIFYYALFPLLRFLLKKNLGFILFLIAFCFIIAMKPAANTNALLYLTKWLPFILLGMLLSYFNYKPKYIFLILSILGIVIDFIMFNSGKFNIDGQFRCFYLCIFIFAIISVIGNYLENNKLVQTVVNYICKYSYAIFLTHHVIIYMIMQYINLDHLTLRDSYFWFFICSAIAIISAVFVQKLYDKIYALSKHNLLKFGSNNG